MFIYIICIYIHIYIDPLRVQTMALLYHEITKDISKWHVTTKRL